MTKKRSKEYEKKRQAAFQERIAAHEKHRRARNSTVLYLLGGLAVATAIVVLLINLWPQDEVPDTPDAGPQPTPSETTPTWADSSVPPDASLAEDRSWTATFDTNLGTITVELDGQAAPQAVASFVSLANDGYFNQTACHRLTTAGVFVLQCGDPTLSGTGGPNYRFGPIENAPENDVYETGTVAMARVRDNAFSMGSQFFIVYEDSAIPADSAGGYTVIGKVTEGLDLVHSVARAGTIEDVSDGTPARAVVFSRVEAQ